MWHISSKSVQSHFHRFIANMFLIHLESKEKFLTNQCEKPDNSKVVWVWSQNWIPLDVFEGTGATRARCGSSMVQHIWGNRNSLAWLITVGSVLKCHMMSFSSLVVPELVFVFVCLVSWLFLKPCSLPLHWAKKLKMIFYREKKTNATQNKRKPYSVLRFKLDFSI